MNIKDKLKKTEECSICKCELGAERDHIVEAQKAYVAAVLDELQEEENER